MTRHTPLALAALALLWTSPAGADPAAARKLNGDGMKLYRSRRYTDALELFKKAVAEDPGFVLAHYNAASMASLVGDNGGVVKELEWLAASKDPAAARALAHAATDKDFDRASMHPRVRALIGLPAVDKADPGDVLLERGGVWGADGDFCGGSAYTFAFRKGGALKIDTQWGCDATDHDTHHAGTWSVVDGKIVLRSKLFTEAPSASFGPCEENAAKGWCLKLHIETREESGDHALHRGPGAQH